MNKNLLKGFIVLVFILAIVWLGRDTNKELPVIELNSIKESGDKHVSVTIIPKDNKTIGLRDWKFVSGENEIVLGDAAYLPRQGKTNREQSIRLKGTSEVILAETPSPIGVSFRENICTGFLDEHQNFYPPLENNCPSALNIISKNGIELEPECKAYVGQVTRCTTLTDRLPPQLSEECQSAIKENIHYNSCVEVYKNDEGFFLNRWRIFSDNLTDDFFLDNKFRILNKYGELVEKFSF